MIQRAATVVAPMPLGFVDCFVLVLSFLLLMVSALYPSSPGAVSEE